MKKRFTLFVTFMMVVLVATAQVSILGKKTDGKVRPVKSMIIDESQEQNMPTTRAAVELPWLETFETDSPTTSQWTFVQTPGSEFDIKIGSLKDLPGVSGTQ